MSNANQQFQELMIIVSVNYGKDLTDNQVLFFKSLAKKYGFNKFKAAMERHMETCKFFPTMAHINELIDGSEQDKQDQIEFVAGSQFDHNLHRAISKCGVYGTPTFVDKITQAVVSSMGWADLCSMKEEEKKWKRREFVQMYKDYSRMPSNLLPDSVKGLIDEQSHRGELKNAMRALEERFEATVESEK